MCIACGSAGPVAPEPSDGERRERRKGEPDRRKLGRPSFEDTSQTSVRLPGALLDRLHQCAARRGDDASTTIRQLLEFALVAEQMLFASRNQ
jgi:hypothetical protein